MKIKGLPPINKRPRCPNCNKLLIPWVTAKTERRERKKTDAECELEREQTGYYGSGSITQTVVIEKTFDGSYKSYGAFCTLRCAAEFANAAYQAGFKRRGA